MPIYEYRCEACGEITEVIQRFADAPLAICPRCGGALKKMVSAPAFQFKGTGWYVTDYARSGGGQKPAEKSGGGESAQGESAGKADGAGKTDSAGKSDGAGKSEGAASGKDAAPSAPAKPTSGD
jgi:putative FmdB family regulatory protein